VGEINSDETQGEGWGKRKENLSHSLPSLVGLDIATNRSSANFTLEGKMDRLGERKTWRRSDVSSKFSEIGDDLDEPKDKRQWEKGKGIRGETEGEKGRMSRPIRLKTQPGLFGGNMSLMTPKGEGKVGKSGEGQEKPKKMSLSN